MISGAADDDDHDDAVDESDVGVALLSERRAGGRPMPSRSSSSKPRSPARVLDPALAGQLIHRAVGDLLTGGIRAPTYEQLVVAAAHAVDAQRVGSFRQAARQQVISGCAVYFRFYAPPGNWQLAGSEVALPGCRLDLLFEHSGPTQALIADELKAGRLADVSSHDSAKRQARRQVAAAGRAFGERFIGVRVLVLGAPARSWWCAADNELRPLGKELS